MKNQTGPRFLHSANCHPENGRVGIKKSPQTKTEEKRKSDYSKSKLLKTKDLSEKTGISSRKINSWFVDNKLMYKKDDEWFTTKKGKGLGGTEKDGFYEQEVLWPEEIASQIKE